MFHEGSQTMIRVAEIGRDPTMRYLARTHRVSVAWLHETFSRQSIGLMYERSHLACVLTSIQKLSLKLLSGRLCVISPKLSIPRDSGSS